MNPAPPVTNSFTDRPSFARVRQRRNSSAWGRRRPTCASGHKKRDGNPIPSVSEKAAFGNDHRALPLRADVSAEVGCARRPSLLSTLLLGRLLLGRHVTSCLLSWRSSWRRPSSWRRTSPSKRAPSSSRLSSWSSSPQLSSWLRSSSQRSSSLSLSSPSSPLLAEIFDDHNILWSPCACAQSKISPNILAYLITRFPRNVNNFFLRARASGPRREWCVTASGGDRCSASVRAGSARRQ